MRGKALTADVPERNRCIRCRARWKQDGEFCRMCHRANQMPDDPVTKAVSTLSAFIRRAGLDADMLKEPMRKEALMQARDARNALDCVRESLRDAKTVAEVRS